MGVGTDGVEAGAGAGTDGVDAGAGVGGICCTGDVTCVEGAGAGGGI